MSLQRLTKKEKFLLGTTLAVAALALLYAAVAEPVFQNWVILKHKIQAKKNAWVKDAKILSDMGLIQSQYQILSGQAMASAHREEDVTSSLGELEKVAKEASILITTIKPEASREIEGLREIVLDVSVEADSASLPRFLYEIEQPTHLFRIKRLTIVPASGDSHELKCTFLLSRLLLDGGS